MKVLHVVTLTSNSGAFGGPLTVATYQTEALTANGHITVMVSTALEHDRPVGGIDAAHLLFRARRITGLRFAGIYSVPFYRWLKSNLRKFDVVHIHASRDLVCLPAMIEARRQNVPFVLQTHGMIVPSSGVAKRAFDFIVTKPLLRRAAQILALQETERHRLALFGLTERRLTIVPNGIPVPSVVDGRQPKGMIPVVLFCARLHPRKRVAAFLEMASSLCASGAIARFLIIGPDDGDGHLVRTAISQAPLQDCLTYEGGMSHEDVLKRMAACAVFVLPSVDEPFPMALLEAMSLAVPCVATTGCQIAEALMNAGAADIVDPDATALANAVTRILENDVVAQEQGNRGRQFVITHASMSAVASQLETVYSAARRGRVLTGQPNNVRQHCPPAAERPERSQRTFRTRVWSNSKPRTVRSNRLSVERKA